VAARLGGLQGEDDVNRLLMFVAGLFVAVLPAAVGLSSNDSFSAEGSVTIPPTGRVPVHLSTRQGAGQEGGQGAGQDNGQDDGRSGTATVDGGSSGSDSGS
jgi:hypothetical protein